MAEMNKWLTIPEAAEMLKVTHRRVHQLRDEGKLTYAKRKNRRRILRADVERYIEQRTAVKEAKEFIGNDSLNLNTINRPFQKPESEDIDEENWHIVPISDAASLRRPGLPPVADPYEGLSPEEQNARLIEEEAQAPVIWVGDVGFQGMAMFNGQLRTAEHRAMLYREQLRAQSRKRFSQVRGL